MRYWDLNSEGVISEKGVMPVEEVEEGEER